MTESLTVQIYANVLFLNTNEDHFMAYMIDENIWSNLKWY